MRAHDGGYPIDTVLGGCLVTGRYQVDPGERVLDLDIDIDGLPNYGRICFSERGVQAMCATLGWTINTPETEEKYTRMAAEIALLRTQLGEMTDALADIVNLPAVIRWTENAARQLAKR